MNKNILIIVLIVAGLFGLMLWGKSIQKPDSHVHAENPGEKSALASAETLYDFGAISMKSGKVNKIFIVNNPTDKDIVVREVTTSCMCTNAYIEKGDSEIGPFGMVGMSYVPPANETIKAGGSMDLKVVYDPNAHGPSGVGSIDRLVYVSDNDGGTLQFEIKAVVTP